MSCLRATKGLGRPALPALLLLLLPAGCRQDMYDQPRADPLEGSALFDDGSSARRPPPGTAPWAETGYYSRIPPAPPGAEPPPAITLDLLHRGQERFAIYCAPCHGLAGDGDGMIVQRGYRRPPSFHIDRLRMQPIDSFVDVVTHGLGVMPGYAVEVRGDDRWAIAAYVRALQLSRSAPLSELPPEDAAKTGAVQ